MTSRFKALILDLGGVLLEWNPQSVQTMLPSQLQTLMNSTSWHALDRGEISLDEACEAFGEMLEANTSDIKDGLEQAQKSLIVDSRLVQVIRELKTSDSNLQLYIMSNISKEHFRIVKNLDLPWSIFTSAFASGVVGMRKPNLCFFQHVLDKIPANPNEVVMIDDRVDNICAARSVGIHGLLLDKSTNDVGQTLRNLFLSPLSRAREYMKSNARNHDSAVEEHHLTFKDNFSQLLIWDLTGDEDLIYLKWPSGKEFPPAQGLANDAEALTPINEVKNGLWNYFYDKPVLTSQLPPDTDTTSIAYLSIPKEYLSQVADAKLVLDAMARNIDPDGIMQTYFGDDRPRTTPEVCCNILRAFYRFGNGEDPRIRKTKDWVVQCLANRACVYGSRFYSTPECFLYFVSRLYLECGSSPFRKELEAIKDALLERINMPANPLALALRISACQLIGLDTSLYQQDVAKLMSLQCEDGGWPAGHFCCIGRSRSHIGNRGYATALAMSIIARCD
ncbi:HAD-like domain-containing protein [Biscogniauxia mediterranea]|nr:HAD-like domain-containing protein [Biscogniauxia mediterranea]